MNAPVTYIPDYVPDPSVVFNWLWTELPWENREGAPRRECWFNPYGQDYTYGRGEGERTYKAHPFGDDTTSWMVEQLMKKLNDDRGLSFDCCFVNGYAHGRQHLGWHADDSPEMDHDHPIAVVSFGAEREIWFRPKGELSTVFVEGIGPVTNVQAQSLGHGSLLLMGAGMQREWQHRIPKSPLGDACGARLSLTYRKLVR